jgi:hypothetical protein
MYMKKITFSILAALALLACWPVQTKAATTVKVIDVNLSAYYSEGSYKGADSIFSFKYIADILGTDTATLDKDGKYMFSTDADGNLSNSYTANYMGFWFDKDGVICHWGDAGASFYIEPQADALKDQFQIYIGQFPARGASLPTYKGVIYAIHGDKQIQFNVSLALKLRPVLDWSTVSFVKSYDVSVTEYPMKSYDAKLVGIPFSEVAAALGTDTLTMVNQAENLIFAKDTLGYSQHFTSGDGSFWMSMDGHIADYNSYWKYVYKKGVAQDSTRYSVFYLNNYYDTANDQIIFEVGQYPGMLTAGTTLHTQEFFVFNGKAVTVNLTLNIVPMEWDKMTDVGDYTYSIKKHNTDGDLSVINVDLDDLASKFGEKRSTLLSKASLYAVDDSGQKTNGYTAWPNPGFWFTKDGTACADGDSAFFDVLFSPNDSALKVGFHTDRVQVGDKYSTDLYLFYNDKYVKFTVATEVIGKSVINNPEVVATYPLEMYALPSADTYPLPKTLRVDLGEAAKALGESVGNFVKNIEVWTLDSLGRYSNDYSCTPTPGFWFDKNDAANQWRNNVPYGVCYATDGTYGVFTFFQRPGVCKVDDSFNPKMFLFDPDLNKGVCYSISLNFVSTLDSMVDVGSRDLSVAIAPDNADAVAVPISMDDFAAAVGIAKTDLVAANSAYPISVYGRTAKGGKTSSMTSDYGFWETASGIACGQDDPACVFGVDYYGLQAVAQQDFDNLYVTVWGEVKNGDELKGTIILAVSDQGALKMYTYNIAIHITDNPDAVNAATLSGSRKAGSVYDLGGRLVRRSAAGTAGLAKGIYIRDGKKIVVR